jgi:outer membrane protein assembly factor BamB
LDGHVINTQTFEVKKDIPNPAMAHFAYNGNGWMWITGDTGGSCDDLVFINTDHPSEDICQNPLPFMNNSGDKAGSVAIGTSIMTLAGDRMWMAGRGGGDGNQNMIIVAYPADMDQLMQKTEPLATVRLMDDGSQFGLLYAGNYLWLLWKGSAERGFLYQLDPQTGATINSLDLVGDQGRSKGDIPVDIATEGDNLWVLTRRQLLRIQLP